MAAHKVALLLIGALLGGLVLYHRRAGAATYPNGVPVNPYAANSGGGDGGGGFDFSSLLPAGPAGAALDPSPAAQTPPVAPEAPASIDNSLSYVADGGTPAYTASNPAAESVYPDAAYVQVDNPTDPFYGATISNVTQSSTFAVPPPGSPYNPGDVVPAYNPQPNVYYGSIANDPNNADSGFFVRPLSSGPGTAPAVSLPLTTGRPTSGQAVAA